MAWTYVPNFALQRDRVRSLIGDTDTTDQLISDEEIALYGTGGQFAQANDYMAAASLVDAIASKFARRVSMSAGGTSVQLQQQFEHYQTLAKTLRSQSRTLTGVAGYTGGISIADKQTQSDDTDSVVPAFTRQMGDRTNELVQPETAVTDVYR